MAENPVFVFIVSFYFLYLLADSRILSLPQCSRMCNSAADFRENVLFPHKCSCSKSCTVYNDCCYDSPYRHTSTSSALEFTCMSVAGLGDFRAVASCPRNWHANSCREFLGHLQPVTSRVTNITYGNVFCASCNGDGDNLIRWNVELRCVGRSDWPQYGLDFTQIKYRSGQLLGRNVRERSWRPCKFFAHDNNFEIIEDLELRPCVLPTRVSRCSRTWAGLYVEQKCRSYEDPVYIGNLPFRNAHCAECNYKDASHAHCIPRILQELLDLRIVEENDIRTCMAISPRRCLTDMGKGIFYSLSNIFDNIDEPMEGIHDSGCLPPAGLLCCRGERYDDNTGKCRRTRSG